MVCIAAFIILCVLGLFVAFLSIFKRDIGKKYWAVFKKSWGCVGKKIRLQKCETNFKDDVKNSLLRKIVLKHPKMVKPISVIIEVFSVIIVLVAVWSLVEATKALLALWALGSCNVSKPSACTLSAETCSVDEAAPKNLFEATGRWFEEWGEIFQAIPDRLREWDAKSYTVDPVVFARTDMSEPTNQPYAVDVVDPSCIACMHSYRNQMQSGFFSSHNTVLLVYPIQLPDGSYKFKHSELVARYFYSTALTDKLAASKIIKRLFSEQDSSGINYQDVFSSEPSSEKIVGMLKSWLKDFGLSEKQITEISNKVNTEQINHILAEVKDMVSTKIKAKGIPFLIYDGKAHLGLFERKYE